MAVAPCAPWFEAEQFSLCEPGDVRPDVMEAAVRAAEAILFVKTQRVYTGVCTDVWRPSQGCGCSGRSSCGCPSYPSKTLRRTPVLGITEILIDGEVLPADAYRLGDPEGLTADQLYRVDGETWPCCQDIALATTEPDTWQITYPWGRTPPPGADLMGQALTCEFLKAWGVGGSGKCRLPRHVTSVTKENITQSILADRAQLIANGSTGLDEVDLWLVSLNPSGADREPKVLTPEALGLGHDPTNTSARRRRFGAWWPW
jgi:hypothetical protein